MHVVVYKTLEKNADGRMYDETHVETYHSLTLACRKAWHHRAKLVKFCIDHPTEDLLNLDDIVLEAEQK